MGFTTRVSPVRVRARFFLSVAIAVLSLSLAACSSSASDDGDALSDASLDFGETGDAQGGKDSACTPSCLDEGGALLTCGDNGCGGSCGTCETGSWCDEGSCVGGCVPACDGKVCGPDGCEGSCGDCAAGSACDPAGQCIPDCVPTCVNETGEDIVCGPDGCGGSCGTCLGGDTCEADGQCVGDCVPACDGKACGPDGCEGTCGDCQGTDTCDAAGQCVGDCVPDCDGKACGPDGCEGTCGDCLDTETCDAAGQCVGACVPDCDGKICGGDGCDGSCGDCGLGQACDANGQCASAGCGDITYDGCCDGETLVHCEDDELIMTDCSSAPSCGWFDSGMGFGYYDCGTTGDEDPTGALPKACGPVCTPSCLDADGGALECGDDGCGGSCGACGNGQTCEAGICSGDCLPLCTDADGGALECGDDGCGGSCGACADGELCEAGTCAADACQGIGFEGCCDGDTLRYCEGDELFDYDCTDGGYYDFACGWAVSADYGAAYHCGPLDMVDVAGDPSGDFPLACPGVCIPDCEGKTCGDDGCGGSCGDCGEGQTCEAGVCTGACVPDCTNDAGEALACGDDGCDGSCGECAVGTCTEDGQCVDACDGLTYEGCCDGGSLHYCLNGEIEEQACVTPEHPDSICGWFTGNDSASAGYYCGLEETPEGLPLLLASGDPDGVFPLLCDGACAPDCTNDAGAAMLCGADGCGGSCGTCGPGQTCDADGQCAGDCVPQCLDAAGAALTCGDDGCGGVCGTCGDTQVCVEGSCLDDCDHEGFTAAGQSASYLPDEQLLLYGAFEPTAHLANYLMFELWQRFGAPSEPGVYPFVADNYLTCTTCVLLVYNCDDDLCEKLFLANSGTMTIDSVGGVGVNFTGNLSDVTMTEVTYDPDTYETTPVVDGETWCLDNVPFAIPIEAYEN